ncbi:MAG: hypothetical protein MHM6MM_001208 [Cercozoa sp. M6MM]
MSAFLAVFFGGFFVMATIIVVSVVCVFGRHRNNRELQNLRQERDRLQQQVRQQEQHMAHQESQLQHLRLQVQQLTPFQTQYPQQIVQQHQQPKPQGMYQPPPFNPQYAPTASS